MLGTGTLNANGQATFTTATLAVGSSRITADYNGSGNFNASTSATVTQTVTKDNSATALTSSKNPSVEGPFGHVHGDSNGKRAGWRYPIRDRGVHERHQEASHCDA